MSALFSEPMLVLFAILAIGSWIGQLSIRGLSLGTAGVLFTALVFGHFGKTVPKEVMDLGLLLFVYAVGISAGPRFFRTFRRRGIQFVIIAAVTLLTGALVTVVLARRAAAAVRPGLRAVQRRTDLHPRPGCRHRCDRARRALHPAPPPRSATASPTRSA